MMLKLATLAATLTTVTAVPQLTDSESNHTFNTWAARHGKAYSSASERLHRLEIWLENARDIHSHKNEGHSWTMELNEFADLSEEEFTTRNGLLPMTNLPLANNITAVPLLGAADLPPSVDWRDHNLVNPVQNQVGI